MRVATIDIGTNSVLLLVAESQNGQLHPLVDRATITRLGQDVDRLRRLQPQAIERTLACLRDYHALLRSLGAERVAAVATSASRDAEGAEGFLLQAEQILGVAPQVISGEREAFLTFAGSLSGLSVVGEVAVQDIGGGSTEIVLGTAGAGQSEVREAVSLDVGSVRMTERFVRTDPPSPDELQSIRTHVRGVLGRAPKPNKGACWVGIAGTITTLAAIDLGLEKYDPSRVHGSTLSRGRIEQLVEQLGGLQLVNRRRTVGLDPRRADVIVAGGIIASEVLGWAQAEELIVSDRGVRWGLALELAADAFF